MKKEQAVFVIQKNVRRYFSKQFERSLQNGDFQECTRFTWIIPTSDHLRISLELRKGSYVNIVRWLEKRIFYFASPKSHQASQDGDLQSIVHEYTQGAKIGINEFKKAIYYGHIHICHWLLNKLGHQFVIDYGKVLMVDALGGGKVKSCQFLIRNGVNPDCKYFPLLDGVFFEEKTIPTSIWMIVEGTFEDKQGDISEKCSQEIIPKICQSVPKLSLSIFMKTLQEIGQVGNTFKVCASLNSHVPEGPLEMIREFLKVYEDEKLLRIKKFYLSLRSSLSR